MAILLQNGKKLPLYCNLTKIRKWLLIVTFFQKWQFCSNLSEIRKWLIIAILLESGKKLPLSFKSNQL